MDPLASPGSTLTICPISCHKFASSTHIEIAMSSCKDTKPINRLTRCVFQSSFSPMLIIVTTTMDTQQM